MDECSSSGRERRRGDGGRLPVRDTGLGRNVAIKLLRQELLEPYGLARLEREAQTLAALNHPHIAGIHGLETHEQ